MLRCSQSHRIQPPGRFEHDAVGPGHDHGQRARPKGFEKRTAPRGDLHAEFERSVESGDVRDQRVIGGPALGGKDPSDGFGSIGTCTKAVNGLGG